VGQRAVVATVAVLVLAWLGIMERDARLQARGIAAAQELDVAGNGARAERAFRDARLLTPDTAPDVSRAFLLRATGRQDEAIALLDDVVAREPENVTAWGVLATFARGHDATAFARAVSARRRLDPLSARSR
jgi:predicted Zn-dependent protease